MDAPLGLHEDNVRRSIGDIFGSLGVDYTLSYATPGGPADLYLQRRRIVIETKARGLACDPDAPHARESNETSLRQLERYLLSEMRRDKEMFLFDELADRPWIARLPQLGTRFG